MEFYFYFLESNPSLYFEKDTFYKTLLRKSRVTLIQKLQIDTYQQGYLHHFFSDRCFLGTVVNSK